MCGHVGIAGNLELKDESTMKRLLLYDFFRGMDSTGLAGIRHANQTAQIAKVASHPIDLFDSKKFDKALTASACSAFIGHNRAATKGHVNSNNAHPYEFDHIVGAHNGTLSVQSHIALENSLGETYEVDSQAIFAHIAKFGIHETMPLLQGAWALVWYDSVLNTINFLRNKERSFWYASTKDNRKILWASEWPMIHAAVTLATPSQKYDLYDEGGFKFFATEENQLYTFDLDRLRSSTDTDYPFEYAKAGELKGKEPAPVVHNKGVTPFQHLPSTKPTDTKTTTRGSTGNEFFRVNGDKDNPFGGYLMLDRVADLAAFGCSFCSGRIEQDDIGITVINHEDIILCKNCSTDPTGNRLVVSEMPQMPSAIVSLIQQISK